ncbi:uncharacterized protein EDB91DRAFT_1153383 [Suillus paluster]|uniref:uncharacterized protein n=1 Tax=Suillus paluster TaxID=48578 RepID=UPI001B874AE5|nr:uncharacterized protein EDB91DRAFT_1153383 [Suillus paluster]KAG1731845.1 hypothetical protein EDB91DRAFT_1153383 [Suillus paluster]
MTPSSSTASAPLSTSSTTSTTALSTSPTTTASYSTGDHIYKGKHTNRSWQQLPPELIRHIASLYLKDVATHLYCPVTWEVKEVWPSRMVYAALCQAIELEKLMNVTPSWCTALKSHLFWNHACALLDPHDILHQYSIVRPQPPADGAAGAATIAPQPYRLPAHTHFRTMTYHSCIICRINSPCSSVGLGAAKRTHVIPRLGVISVCREHRKTTFCGVCLREAPAAECDPQFDVQSNMRLSGYNQLYSHGNFNLSMGGYNPYATTLNPALMVLCSENEDDETWPGVDATCRSCRTEGLWNRIKSSARDREAIGGPRFVQSSSSSRSSPANQRHMALARVAPWKYASADWETRQTVDAFIELGEGSITEVLNVAREKLWLRSYTKMPELMEQAVAATRWASEGMGTDFSQNTAYHHREPESVVASQQDHTRTTEGGDSYSPINSLSPSRRSRSPSPRSAYSSDYEGSEDEDDPDLLSMTEDAGGVRDLAIADWARTRILDGHWCSPADQWYGYARPIGGGVRDPGEEPDCESETDDDEPLESGQSRRRVRVTATHPCPWTLSRPSSPSSLPSPTDDSHPRLSTVRSQAPPSFGLCEHAFRAFSKQLRQILLPGMNNIVRRLVIESANGIGGAWVDPAVRASKMNLEDVLAELRTPGVWFDGVDWAAGGLDLGGRREDDSLSSTSASTRSDGSHTTSPVLSTTTLHTTPSPPPSHAEEKEHHEAVISRPKPPQVVIPIPVSPVLESPKLLHPIPYVPVTLAHMAQYSLEAFKQVWREACAPLYHCRCSVCERAMVKANVAAGNLVTPQVRPAPQNDPQTRVSQPQPPQEHEHLTEIVLEEVRVPRNNLVKEEEEEELEDEEELATEEQYELTIPRSQTHTVTPRKRSSGDLEAENAAAGDSVEDRPVEDRTRRGESVAPNPTPRQRKRSSEELDGGNDSPPSRGDCLQKRLRVEESSPSSRSAPRALSVSPPVLERADGYSRKGFVDAGDGDFSCLRTGLVNGGELDGLYVFEES